MNRPIEGRSPLTVLISLDGVAPRNVTTVTMPRLTQLGAEGGACWSARTVVPSITLPAHTSLLHGVDPSEHGIFDNTPIPVTTGAPTILELARTAGMRTGALYAWTPMHATLEATATDERVTWDGGYDLADDELVCTAACRMITSGEFDLLYVYLAAADLVGHDHGWGSDRYIQTLNVLDAHLGRVLDAAGPEASVVVTTDHGGLGKDHTTSRPEDVETWVVVRSAGHIAPGTIWQHASILDVAPTVAALTGTDPSPLWQGASLVGQGQQSIDMFMEKLASMAAHHYGENIHMLDHSLQTAALAQASGASESLVAAALLHDIGHLSEGAGEWGLPTHAEVGERDLQALLPPAIWQAVGSHVDAKRYLVATEDYAATLSDASVITLAQQGGPFSLEEAKAFSDRPGADDAVSLRRWDDHGKAVDVTVASLDSYRPLLAQQLRLVREPVSAEWARDACTCPECRDPHNSQHLIDVTDLAGWTVAAHSQRDATVTVTHTDGRTHVCQLPTREEHSSAGSTDGRWGTRLRSGGGRHAFGSRDWASSFAKDLHYNGIAVLTGVPTEPGQVLDIAQHLGFVRETNYGRLFDVWSEPEPNNLAYSSLGLPLHTDNPYRDPCPTVQLLHCLRPAAEGGASRFADGFAAAERLRVSDPEAFVVLSTSQQRFRFSDEHVDLQATRPLIEVDPMGTVRAVSVNHRSMETPAAGPGVQAFYAAYASLVALLNDPTDLVDLKLQSGELVGFDNRRVLHARTAFSATAPRHLQGCYIDIDSVSSLARKSI